MAVYFYGCITMDGYLADSQHRIDWLHQLGSVEDTGYDDFYRQMDITIMGKRTFEEIQDLQDVERFYQATENYVFTHDRHLPVSNYQPVAGDVVDFVRQINKGKNIFVIGGNSLVGPLLDADLFDHLIIQIAPLILGKGVPLFTQEEGQRFYQLDSLRQFGPFAEAGFQPKKSEIEKGVDRMIKIYDTMSRDLREFVPIEDGKVKMYVCGPTVYNYIHVGNARSTVAFDTIRRYFEYRGYDVAYISNFTDVDDKIINRAKGRRYYASGGCGQVHRCLS